MRLCITIFGVVLFLIMGCGQDEKIAALEKQNQELKAEMEKGHATTDYDLQAKCSKDAKTWFGENWSRDKDTVLLDFTNHYNKSMNKCFIQVEYHYIWDKSGSWINDMTLWDVYENSKYGNFGELHMITLEPNAHPDTKVSTCEVYGKKCSTIAEFNDLTRPYMSN